MISFLRAAVQRLCGKNTLRLATTRVCCQMGTAKPTMWLGESVTPGLLGALATVAVGIVLVNRKPAEKAPQARL